MGGAWRGASGSKCLCPWEALEMFTLQGRGGGTRPVASGRAAGRGSPRGRCHHPGALPTRALPSTLQPGELQPGAGVAEPRAPSLPCEEAWPDMAV